MKYFIFNGDISAVLCSMLLPCREKKKKKPKNKTKNNPQLYFQNDSWQKNYSAKKFFCVELVNEFIVL